MNQSHGGYRAGFTAGQSAADSTIAELQAQLTDRESELLRVRTTGHGAAHALDIIGQYLGLPIEHRTHEHIIGAIAAEREAVRVLAKNYFVDETTPDCPDDSEVERWERARFAMLENQIAVAAIEKARGG